MKLDEILDVVDLEEGAKIRFKRVGNEIRRKYRCTSGRKKGKIVASPQSCAQRKDPARIRRGRKVMRSKKGIIQRKSSLTKRKSISKLIARMNKRLSGK